MATDVEIAVAEITAKIVNDLRNVKQRVYNRSVEGNGERPDEVVDSVVYAVQNTLEEFIPGISKLLYNQVLNFYPDYIDEDG